MSFQSKLSKFTKVNKSKKLRLGVYQKTDWRAIINHANCSVENSLQKLDIDPSIGLFNSDMSKDVSSCYTNLVAHRLLNKFVRSGDALNTKQVAFDAYIAYESTLKRVNDDFMIWGSTPEHLILRKASMKLHKWFSKFKWDLRDAFIEFSPGKTFNGSSKQVSVYAKLLLRENWTTHYGCIDETVELIYYNRGLKAAAKRLFSKDINHNDLYSQFSGSKEPGFEIFRSRLLAEVLTVVDGASGSTVPKNNETDRFINIEAMFPMFLQRIVASVIRKRLTRAGNTLDLIRCRGYTKSCDPYDQYNGFDAQKLHQLLITSRNKATIDFSNASDSVLTKVVQALFPYGVTELLIKTRSTYVDIDGELVEPYKLSSMGNGFTFEVMSALLYSIAHVLDSSARVFGDDVIIANTHAPTFIAVTKIIGFQPNMKKTFINSPFRESCGAFFHDDVGFLTSFEFTRMKTEVDVITFCNKLYIILHNENTKFLSLSLRQELSILHGELCSLIPASQKGYAPEGSLTRLSNMALYVYEPNWRKKQARKPINVGNYLYYASKVERVYKSNHASLHDACLVFIPFWAPKIDSEVLKLMKADDARLVTFLSLLQAGRLTKPTLRGEGRWVHVPAFVSPTGAVTLVRNLLGRCTDPLANVRGTKSERFSVRPSALELT